MKDRIECCIARPGPESTKAHFRFPIPQEMVLKTPMVVDPLGLYDCCPTTDGAAAAILTTPQVARQLKKDYILIKGMGLAVAYGFFSMPFQEDNDFLGSNPPVKHPPWPTNRRAFRTRAKRFMSPRYTIALPSSN